MWASCLTAFTVDRKGVEPLNGVAELIYSQRPLATWIPVRLIVDVLSYSSEPTARIELATLRLQGGRSAAELRRRVSRAVTSCAGDNLSPAERHYTYVIALGQDVEP